VHSVVPSSNNVFVGCDEQFSYQYHMLEFVDVEFEKLTPLVVPTFFSPELKSGMTNWFSKHLVLPGWTALDKSFFKSDMYNLIYRPLNQHHGIHAPVTEYGKPIGLLNFFRPCNQNPFGHHEQALFHQLLPYVAHALQASCDKDIPYCEYGTFGLMVMDIQGKIQYLNQDARKLLALAYHPLLNVDAREKEAELFALLAQLSRNLDGIFRSQDAPPPTCCYVRPKGRFIFRAYWLDRQNNEPGGLVGMTIEHQEPLALKVLRTMQNLPLSPMQKEVALLLVQGFSNEKIGQRLHIKLTTVKEHIVNLYTKLDINHREELLPKLLATKGSDCDLRGFTLFS